MNLFSDIRKTENGQHVMLATTVYADPSVSYTFSLACSRQALTEAGIQSSLVILSGNCYLDDARNKVIGQFLDSECTELVFLDADVSWIPQQLVKLCQFEDVDIVGGIYPKRSRHDRTMPVCMFTPEMGEPERRPGLIEVASLPTGFMRIKRHVIEKMVEGRPVYGNEKTPWLFRLDSDKNGARVGEDFRFCNDWRESFGGKLWAACDLRLTHVGQEMFTSSLSEALRLQDGSTLRYVAQEVQADRITVDLLSEAMGALDNIVHIPPPDVLFACIAYAKKAKLPVLEMGSGLTSILMAAAGATVYSLEESAAWAHRTHELAEQAGVADRLNILVSKVEDGWYSSIGDIPNDFAFMVVDGPEDIWSRFAFIARLPSIPRVVIFDDMNISTMAERAMQWVEATGRNVIAHVDRLMIVG